MLLTLTELEKSSIGIIGGADGPTAIMVSGNPIAAILAFVGTVAVIAAAVILTVHLIKKHKKKP